MSAKYIIAALAGSFAIAYASDVLVAQKKIFGACVTYMVSRHDAEDGGGQGVVAGDGQEVPGMASHRGTAGRHEPHQPPELHRQGSQALRRLMLRLMDQTERDIGCS
ncbi:uncharacterized protein LOC8066907 isoform X1 [Sorghum bicolor]|uniref:Uncharacterized protein n=1 Tax=Sorghum bicolor TaxID=4558 RepID=C5Z2T3_SORBI|nr:uncharacterized protein LOC8066907 isoform X1 [Sorghum bicolor]EER89079.2 hypothetical protein SORBI_3010G012001 [Sorghum bicolor]|eukprot:XP_021304882.1 uncharacterized protein LOC8066907 isoform X1 [Sorghum bicolor]